MSADTQVVRIKSDDIPHYIDLAWRTFEETGFKPVVYLEGPPGIGKSHQVAKAVQRIAERMDRKVVRGKQKPTSKEFGFWVTQMANSSEEVISGLPWVSKKENVQKRAVVGSFPQGNNATGVWFCDEPLQAGYTQRFLAQLVYGGQIDEYYQLPNDVLIVMAGNSARDRAGVAKMWTHFANRIMILKVEPDVEGALKNFYRPPTPEVSIYLRWFPDKLFQFDPRKNDGPFPTARTWDFVNTMLTAGADPENDYPVFQGYLGAEAAMEFRACFQALRNLPPIDKLFAKPEEYKQWVRETWKTNHTTITALSFVVLRKLREDRDIDFAGRAIQLFSYGRPEMVAGFLAAAEQIDENAEDGKSIHDCKEYAAFVAEHAELVTQ